MPETLASHKVNGHIAVSSAFLLLALAGWGGFAYSARTAGQQRVTLATQMQRIRTEQDEMRAERDRLRTERIRGSAHAFPLKTCPPPGLLEAIPKTHAPDHEPI